MKYISNLALLIFVIFGFFQCQSQKSMIDNRTVDSLDLNRYLGTWYEIARFPHSFEKNLVGVTANYSLKPNGKIRVINQGFKKTLDGKPDKAVGKAYIPDPENPARLKVSFFWIFYSDYLVMELDQENYNWAVIGSGSPDYLWILSRQPVMEDELYQDLLNRLRSRGYDLQKLEKVPQKPL